MAIDHEAHKIRIKAVSDRMNHPMTYNDAGAPRENFEEHKVNGDTRESMRSMNRDHRHRNMITGGR